MTQINNAILIFILSISVITSGYSQLNEKEASLGLLDDSNDISPFENPEEASTKVEFKKSRLAILQKQLFTDINKLNKKLIILDNELVITKEDLELMKEEGSSSEDAIVTLRNVLKNVENEYSEGSKRLKKLNKMAEKIENDRDNMDKWDGLAMDTEELLFEKEDSTVSTLEESDFFFEINEEIYNDKDCNIIFDGYDEDIKKDRKETEMSFFFSYTHPKLKPHFKDKNFLECKGSISNIKGTYYLQLTLKLASKDASRNYGQIERNSLMRFQFVNGQKHYLSNIYPDAGTIEKYTGNTIYKAVFPIDKDYLKLFKTVELDHIGIIWTSGYEQYDVYEVDFLMQHLNCLDRD